MAKASPKVPVGGVRLATTEIEINVGLPNVKIKVRNTGDRPIQIGSHYHFFEVNRALEFDRAKSFGMRLDIPATTGIRFEPGDEKEVILVPLGGKRYVYGFYNLVDGWAGDIDNKFHPNYDRSVALAQSLGFKFKKA